jgi:hypothetical protein
MLSDVSSENTGEGLVHHTADLVFVEFGGQIVTLGIVSQ